MAQQLELAAVAVAEPEGPRRATWTRADVAVMEEAGIFDGRHYELVGGELIDKMGKKRPHVMTVRHWNRRLTAEFGWDLTLTEAPIDVATADNPKNEPEPDLCVLHEPLQRDRMNPLPSDVALLIEVADTTLRYDRTVKAALYARAGIADYWVAAINTKSVTVFRDPRDGRYTTELEFGPNDRISPLCRPEWTVEVASLFPD